MIGMMKRIAAWSWWKATMQFVSSYAIQLILSADADDWTAAMNVN